MPEIFKKMKKNFFQFYKNNIFFVHDVIIGIFLFAAFFPLFSRLIAYGWDTADYVHAYFVLPISLTILWIRRKQLVRREGFGFKSFLLFLLSLGIYIFSSIEGFIFLETFSFVLMISAIFYLRFTRESIKTISFPLWYLIFLVPPPSIAIDMITFPLRKISVYGSKIFLDFFNLPVRVYGVIVKVGDHELFVSDACSGFRSIVILLSIGAVYISFQHIKNHKKWLVFLAIFPLGVFGNVLRITITGLMAHIFGLKFAMGFFHYFSGILLFAFVVYLIIFICDIIRPNEKQV